MEIVVSNKDSLVVKNKEGEVLFRHVPSLDLVKHQQFWDTVELNLERTKNLNMLIAKTLAKNKNNMY